MASENLTDLALNTALEKQGRWYHAAQQWENLEIPGLNIIQQNHFPNQSTARTDHSHIPPSGNGITGEKSSKVLAWAILLVLFCENTLRWQLCLHYPTRCRTARGDFSWVTGVQLKPRNFWKTKLHARHPNRKEGRFWGLIEDETKPSIPLTGNPSKRESENYWPTRAEQALACADLHLHQRSGGGREWSAAMRHRSARESVPRWWWRQVT